MLTHLSIQNIVLIDRAELACGSGLCVLTGETGAGKSILLDALGLVLGARSEVRLLRAGADKAVVTAEFQITMTPALTEWFDALGIDAEDSLILRRQLGADGKSRAFVNDQPVSAKALKELGEMLVEVHGQHQQRGLLDTAMHGRLLDAYGQHEKLLEKTTTAFRAWREQREALAALDAEIEQTEREKEYLTHMRAELQALNPQPGEEEALSDQRTRMMQSEKMATTLDDVLQDLSQPRPVHESLRGAQAALMRSTLKDAERFAPAIEALERAMTEVQEAEECLGALGRELEYDPEELEQVEERLFALKAAGRKYNLPLEELPGLFAEVEEKLTTLAEQANRRQALLKEVTVAQEVYVAAAEALRAARTKTAGKLEKALHAELEPLKMGATRFQVAMEAREESGWGERGMDVIRFEAATNKGSAPGPLNQIASGGELSRFMLALAVVLADARATPVMIFDEIDTGTGGAVADAIGKRLKQLSQHVQVLVVTHLPQVAALGATHFFIEKEEHKQATVTNVRLLDEAERQEELARMISGATVSQEARQAAKQLLKEAV